MTSRIPHESAGLLIYLGSRDGTIYLLECICTYAREQRRHRCIWSNFTGAAAAAMSNLLGGRIRDLSRHTLQLPQLSYSLEVEVQLTFNPLGAWILPALSKIVEMRL